MQYKVGNWLHQLSHIRCKILHYNLWTFLLMYVPSAWWWFKGLMVRRWQLFWDWSHSGHARVARPSEGHLTQALGPSWAHPWWWTMPLLHTTSSPAPHTSSGPGPQVPPASAIADLALSCCRPSGIGSLMHIVQSHALPLLAEEMCSSVGLYLMEWGQCN